MTSRSSSLSFKIRAKRNLCSLPMTSVHFTRMMGSKPGGQVPQSWLVSSNVLAMGQCGSSRGVLVRTIRAGANRDDYRKSKDMVKQIVDGGIPLFESLHPNCKAIFVFDHTYCQVQQRCD